MEQLLANGRRVMEEDISCEVELLVKLFTPDANATWLLAWVEPGDMDIAWGLCDLGFPEIGPVRLSEISAVRGALGLPVERDLYFATKMSLSDYARDVRERGHYRGLTMFAGEGAAWTIDSCAKIMGKGSRNGQGSNSGVAPGAARRGLSGTEQFVLRSREGA